MREIAHLSEIQKISLMPIEVQESIKSILVILDDSYGENRNKYSDDGGYVIVVESIEDFQIIKSNTYIDIENIIVEYVDKIECSMGKIYTSSLVLCNNDFSISLIIPLEITPENILNQI